MAPGNPFRAHPDAFQYTKPFDRFIGIVGAGRMETADPGREKPRKQSVVQGDGLLVYFYDKQQNFLHFYMTRSLPYFRPFVNLQSVV